MAKCPRCNILLESDNVLCPQCGVNINQPQPQVTQFSCPYCNNVFSAESLGIELEIDCPMCKKRIVIC